MRAYKRNVDGLDHLKLQASLVAQWRGKQAWSFVQEEFPCHGAIKPVYHDYWAHALEPTNCSDWAHATVTEACAPRTHAPY